MKRIIVCAGLSLWLLCSACAQDAAIAPSGSGADGVPHQPAVAADWCAGHGLPESKCTICNPELTAGFKAAGDWCEEHGLPESACPSCNPVPPPQGVEPAKLVPGTRIRFRSEEIEEAAGLLKERVRAARLATDFECTARIEFDRNRLADIRASIPGVVVDVEVDLGEWVAPDADLFVLESADVARLQSDLRVARERVGVARANYERHRELRESRIVSDRQVELAREGLETAEAGEHSIEDILRIAGTSEADPHGSFRVRAPIAGTVVRRPATIGTFATNGVTLATVADTSHMWAVLEVREADAGALRIGLPVTIRVESLPDRPFAGAITWIASEVDARTRTVAARAEVANEGSLLRAEQFARATVEVDAKEVVLVVPRSAIQRVDEGAVVFVSTGGGVYEPRFVTVGRSDGERVEVQGNLLAGEFVVTDGAYLLKTELSPDSIGAGCCDVDPPGGA